MGLIPDYFLDPLDGILESISGFIEGITSFIADAYNSVFITAANITSWIGYILSWIATVYEWLFIIILAMEAAIIMISLRGDNYFENLVKYHYIIWGVFLKAVFEIIKFTWKIAIDIAKVLSNLIPFT